MKEVLKDPILFFIALSIILACTSLGSPLFTATIYALTVLLITYKDGFKLFRHRSISLYLGFVAIVLIYSVFGKGTLSSSSYRMRVFSFISMFSTLIISYHLKTLKIKQVKGLLVVACIAIVFSIIGTTAVSFVNPMAVRIYGFGEVEAVDLEIASRYYSMGMMSYQQAHAFSVLAVVLSVVLLHVKNKWVKVFSAVLLILIIRLFFIMTITTALLLTILGVTLVFATFLSHGRLFVAISLTAAAVIVFFVAGFATIFLDFSSTTNAQITEKLVDLLAFAETGAFSGQLGGREELYIVSLKTFMNNPVFGWGSDNGSRQFIGEHSYFLDFLAYYGLFAFLFFLSWWKEFSSAKSFLPKDIQKYYIYSFIPAIGLCAFKGYSVCGSLPFMSLIIVQIVFLYIIDSDKSVCL